MPYWRSRSWSRRRAAGGDGPGSHHETDLVVSAAASLSAAFTMIGAAFEDAKPGVTVSFNFAASDGLATQIVEGAPVDVFASASPTWMDTVQDEGPGVTGRADFARNGLAIVVPSDDPAGIEGLKDLTEDGVQLVLAAEGVPAGDYARKTLANAGIADGRSRTSSPTRRTWGRRRQGADGEADAGIAYVTDVTRMSRTRSSSCRSLTT